MHLAPIIRDLAIILGVAGSVTVLFRKIRQPVVLGYLVAGFIIGPHTPPFPLVKDLPNIQVLAELGVIFLMFSLGLEFTFHKLVRVGTSAAGTAVVEVLGMVAVGLVTGKLLGWGALDSLFLGGILSISSTTIIIKAFDELNLRTRRFSELVFGVLIVEDLVAILLLVALSTVAATHSLFSIELVIAAVRLGLVVGSWFLIGYFVIPSLFRYIARWMDSETLTVASSGLCLLLVVTATHFSYSAALGAFIMGSILAETNDAHRIAQLIGPLRDLFGAVFFVSVGMLVNPLVVMDNLWPILVISIATVLGKIVTSSLGALLTGQPVKRSVQIGFSLAQIGEFSFIIATLGATLKVTSDFLYPIAVTVSVITTFTTPYLIRASEPCAIFIDERLPPWVKALLYRYNTWWSTPGTQAEAKAALRKSIIRFVLNGIVVTLMFLFVDQLGVPWASQFFPRFESWPVLGWLSAIGLSAPFIWGMFFAFRPAQKRRNVVSLRGPSLLKFFFGQILSMIWIGVLSNVFLTFTVSFLFFLGASVLLFLAFYRKLEVSYKWFEKRFLSNLKEKEGEAADKTLSDLAPWDLHLVSIRVHPNAELAGKTLKDSAIRTRFGLNIVAIRRGEDALASPTANERTLPADELLVLGTDDQIDHFRQVAEVPPSGRKVAHDLTSFSLKKYFVSKDSPFVGQTIRGSGIRKELGGLVVGLEKGNLRTVNPDPEVSLEPGDVLWVVGERWS